MSDSNSGKLKGGLWHLMTKPIRVPSWIIALLCAVLVIYLVFTFMTRRAELDEARNAPDRPRIESLDAAHQRWSSLSHPIVREAIESTRADALEDSVQFCSLIAKRAVRDSPRRASAVNSLANAYVMQSKYDLAMPFYEEARGMLERHLGPEHPDVAVVDQNILLARKLAQRQKSE